MRNIAEPVFIQAFIPKATVKALYKSVMRWLTWLDKPQLHTMLKDPLFERAAGKFRALIGSIVAGQQRKSAILSRIRVT